ncbi:cobyric acid synthase [Desulfopila aestuarii]|uniref:Cobyric acid synthase n=1 Tax=Desulfopila aestuarii DSM 18488 TaxID=1121416 RepID=A0A1M7YBV5_9BACT|nr:cobyric acid synthase [Desulfopila aestuarii]SHO50122.1 L-threonine O-3-phosphate decarboxylase /adenosylcobyric acid synthase (glutamine-hydrolysing) [Desulfopila aestuarii DSM 18488]
MTEIPGRNRTGHGGNIHAVLREAGQDYGQIIDFSANINPIGPPEWLRAMVSRELEQVLHYPDPDYRQLVDSIARYTGVSSEMVIPANGSTELLYLLPRVLGCQRAVIPVPSYIDYVKAVRQAGMDVVTVPLHEQNGFAIDSEELGRQLLDNDLVIFGSPNNPTGVLVPAETILALAGDFPKVTFLIDEAFLDFVIDGESVAGKRDNILTLNSMTKFFGVPGLRLGFGVFPTEIAAKLQNGMPPWTINCIAQSFGVACLKDTDYQQQSRETAQTFRAKLIADLEGCQQLRLYPSAANYLLIRLTNGTTSPQLAEQLLKHGILIRCCDNYEGLDDRYFRIAVRTAAENERMVEALTTCLAPDIVATRRKVQRPRTPAIMFQGTSSNAGKSVLTAAMCRILLQDGVRVAPFKAQNMSLNSFVTLNGEEMGRAQVVQAQAAKLDPDVRMNPILLKPNSDTGSQIIVKGKPVGNMSVLDYGKYKPQAWQAVRECYDSLADEYQAIVLEGAGSPGEVNLKQEDIVNMKMAAYAEAPVLLVGDIDRGGVYASFVGTMEVLAPWERELIGGFVVNRFRGQASLLEDAHRYLIEHTGREALGVVPYLSDLGLPEEDSVSFKAGSFNRASKEQESIRIALLNFPHISNFTDVEPLLDEPDVTLSVVDSPVGLDQYDLVILPGSKNVIGDLRFVQDKGFVGPLKQLAESGKEIVGICGGYQILGRSIADPLGIESSKATIDALGLLNLTTELKAEKRLVRQQGTHLASGLEVFGYEIHHGISVSPDHAPVLKFASGGFCGSGSNNHLVWGTYLHGIFDSDSFRRWFLDSVRERKGYPKLGRIVAPYNLEAAFDRLADTVRSNLDMEKVYQLLKL